MSSILAATATPTGTAIGTHAASTVTNAAAAANAGAGLPATDVLEHLLQAPQGRMSTEDRGRMIEWFTRLRDIKRALDWIQNMISRSEQPAWSANGHTRVLLESSGAFSIKGMKHSQAEAEAAIIKLAKQALGDIELLDVLLTKAMERKAKVQAYEQVGQARKVLMQQQKKMRAEEINRQTAEIVAKKPMKGEAMRQLMRALSEQQSNAAASSSAASSAYALGAHFAKQESAARARSAKAAKAANAVQQEQQPQPPQPQPQPPQPQPQQ